MKFPNMMYKCPGTHHCHGGTFDYLGVANQAEADAAAKAGWSPTLPDAMVKKYGHTGPVSKPAPVPAPTPAPMAETELLGDDGSEDESEEQDKTTDEEDGEQDDNAPPTRAELAQQATKLGIKFTKKTPDEELAKKIAEASKE